MPESVLRPAPVRATTRRPRSSAATWSTEPSGALTVPTRGVAAMAASADAPLAGNEDAPLAANEDAPLATAGATTTAAREGRPVATVGCATNVTVTRIRKQPRSP